MEIYGTIRNYSGVWNTIDDETHASKNITSVLVVSGSSTSGYVEVHFPACAKVGTFIVVPDETCAKVGIICGSSVGLDVAKISFSKNGVAIAPNTITNAKANIWLYGVMIDAPESQQAKAEEEE